MLLPGDTIKMKSQKERIKNAALRLINLIELDAPMKIIKNEIDLMQAIVETEEGDVARN